MHNLTAKVLRSTKRKRNSGGGGRAGGEKLRGLFQLKPSSNREKTDNHTKNKLD